MKCAFTLQLDTYVRDILVEAEPTSTIGDIARYILENHPARSADLSIQNPTLLVQIGQNLVMHTPNTPLRDANILNGAQVQLVSFLFDERVSYTEEIHGILVDEATQFAFPLVDGLTVGSAEHNDVQLAANDLDAVQFSLSFEQQRLAVRDLSVDKTTVFDTQTSKISAKGARFEVRYFATSIAPLKVLSKDHQEASNKWYNRYKFLPKLLEPKNFEAPKEPTKSEPARLPWAMMLVPLMMGAVMYFVMPNPTMVLFMLMSPVMMLMNFVNSKSATRKKNQREQSEYAEKLAKVKDDVTTGQKHELNVLQQRYDTFNNTELWSKHIQDDDFLTVSIGYGEYSSQTQLDGEAKTFDGMPFLIDLSAQTGVWSEGTYPGGFLNGFLLQAVRSYSPSDLQIALFAGRYAKDLEWLKWSQNLKLDSVASDVETERKLLNKLAQFVGQYSVGKTAKNTANDTGEKRRNERSGKYMLVIIIDIANENWHLLENLLQSDASNILCLWVGNSEQKISWSAKNRLRVLDEHQIEALVNEQYEVSSVSNYFCSDFAYCEEFAKSIANTRDLSETPSENVLIPKSINLDTLFKGGAGLNAPALLERWAEQGSALGCVVGMGERAPFVLDIKKHGPHALVGGTTGAGKSEFLQTWVLSLALSTSPRFVNFLLVDYKGGAAFSECVNLPHTVGLVTDLNPHLCKRVMISLKAELHRREVLLNSKRVKDLEELHSAHPEETLPALVIVVDEFAALAVDLPEFVDKIVDIAARGRSLGVHLIMATQRPGGVIKDSLKANTNLRIALRVADEGESRDIIQSEQAAHIPRETPGRMFVKVDTLSPQELQCAYVGNTETESLSRIQVSDFQLVGSAYWGSSEPEAAAKGESFLQAAVKQVQYAYMLANLPQPYRPWKDPLPEQIEYTARGSIALVDKPDIQDQVELDLRADNVLIYGKPGSGKSSALETVAVHNLMQKHRVRGGVFLINCTNAGVSLGLHPLCQVIRTHELEKLYRLLSGIIAGQITDATLLVDGIDLLKDLLEQSGLYDLQNLFTAMLGQASSAKIQLVATLSRAGGIHSNWSSAFTKQIYFALASENEYAYAGIDPTLLQNATPGRGVLDGEEAQFKQINYAHIEKALSDIKCTAQLPTLKSVYPYQSGILGVDVVNLSTVNFDMEECRDIFIIGGRKSGKSSAAALLKQLFKEANSELSVEINELDGHSVPRDIGVNATSSLFESDLPAFGEGADSIAGSVANYVGEGAREMEKRVRIRTATPNFLSSDWELKSSVNKADLCIVLDTSSDVASTIIATTTHPSFAFCENSPGRGYVVFENESQLVQLSQIV